MHLVDAACKQGWWDHQYPGTVAYSVRADHSSNNIQTKHASHPPHAALHIASTIINLSSSAPSLLQLQLSALPAQLLQDPGAKPRLLPLTASHQLALMGLQLGLTVLPPPAAAAAGQAASAVQLEM
jgi:hypothetical protein